MNMYCHHCGNRLTSESLYCNRCGSKIQSQSATEPRRAAHLAVPPPRPARRAPTVPSISDPESFEGDEEDYPDRQAEEDYREDFADEEQVIFKITPALYEVAPTYLWAAALSLIVTAVNASAGGPIWLAVVGATIFFITPIIRHIRLKRTVYTLTNIKIGIQSGIFSKSTRNIPLRHIQDVTVNETLKERLIGVGDVLIDSAAVEGKIAMNNIRNPRKYVDMILDQLQHWN